MKFYDWSPGNGTRYVVGFHTVTVEDSKFVAVSPGGWIVCFPNSMFKSYAFQPEGALDDAYVGEKLGIELDGDLRAIVQLMAHVTDRPIREGLWPKCNHCGLPRHPGLDVPWCVSCEYGVPEIMQLCESYREKKASKVVL